MPSLTHYPTATVSGYTFHVSAIGFPVVECSRCGGTGRFSFNYRDGDRCFGCGGNKVCFAPGVPAKEAKAYSDFRRARKTVTADCMEVGDLVRDYYAKRGESWRKVVAVEVTDQPCGSLLKGTDESKREYFYYHVITFEDGEQQRMNAHRAWQRKAAVDPAPYAERAQRAYVARLRRRGIKPNANEFAAAQKRAEEEQEKTRAAAAEQAAQKAAAERAEAVKKSTGAAYDAALKLFEASKAIESAEPEMARSLMELAQKAVDGAKQVSGILED